MKKIQIKWAKVHNLKNIDINFLRNKINVLVWVSWSWKSTIAYDILATEGQRQFLESISTFAARLLKKSQKPNIDSIKNLSPTISIDQKKLRASSRSTVGTSTEIYTYLRLLFSRFGSVKDLDAAHFSFNSPKGACHMCKGLGIEYTIDPHSVLDYNLSLSQWSSKHNLFKPGSRYYKIIEISKKVDMDKPIKNLSDQELAFLLYSPRVNLLSNHQWFVQNFHHRGIITALIERAKDKRWQSETKKKKDGIFWITKKCKWCNWGKLNTKSLSSKINNKNIWDFSNMQLDVFLSEIQKINKLWSQELLARIIGLTKSLIDLDLNYLSINRSLDTLSGWETQRLKLAREMGSDLIEMIYILDEPTAWLHAKDRKHLIEILHKLKQAGNTIVVVEHDDKIIEQADHIIEIWPYAGLHGGNVMFSGDLQSLKKSKQSITSKYLNQKNKVKDSPRESNNHLSIKWAKSNNLKNIDVDIPLGILCSIVGVSGSGKSSLMMKDFVTQFAHKDIVVVDQSWLSGTARWNIATYTGIFTDIRKLFAKENNINYSLFSSNSKWACPYCKWLGFNKIDMHFMWDTKVICEVCKWKKYQQEVLKYKYKEKDISEVLDMTIDEASKFFVHTQIQNKLKTLIDVGLAYLTLGQTHDTFSWGESQRLKLASQLHKTSKIFVLDEPTSWLHFSDIQKLLQLLNNLVDKGNSVIVIEHNLDLICQSDRIIEMGPMWGFNWWTIIAKWTPWEILKINSSIIWPYLKW